MTRLPRFTTLQRALHWIMAVCILTMLFVGVHMVSTVNPKYLTLFTLHKTLGNHDPGSRADPARLPPALWGPSAAARPPRAHEARGPLVPLLALYALMIGLPLIGWAMLSAAGYPIVLWGGLWLPPIAPQGEGLHTALWIAHVSLAYVFYSVILLHVAAALFHALVRRDGVFEAMAGDLRHEAPNPARQPAE